MCYLLLLASLAHAVLRHQRREVAHLSWLFDATSRMLLLNPQQRRRVILLVRLSGIVAQGRCNQAFSYCHTTVQVCCAGFCRRTRVYTGMLPAIPDMPVRLPPYS